MASLLTIQTYQASQASWTEHLQVDSAGRCSEKWRRVPQRDTYMCHVRRSTWRISLSEPNQSSAESKLFHWLVISASLQYVQFLICTDCLSVVCGLVSNKGNGKNIRRHHRHKFSSRNFWTFRSVGSAVSGDLCRPSTRLQLLSPRTLVTFPATMHHYHMSSTKFILLGDWGTHRYELFA